MTREEFYEKYKDVEFKFHNYYKYDFYFIGYYLEQQVTIYVGGNPDEIYRLDVTADCIETISSLEPYYGYCGEDSFNDY